MELFEDGGSVEKDFVSRRKGSTIKIILKAPCPLSILNCDFRGIMINTNTTAIACQCCQYLPWASFVE
jgi:hypothetical protein